MPDSPIIHKETLHELLVGVGRTIAETTGEQLKDAIEALREDRDDRHSLRNAAETALSTSAANKIKIESLEQRLLGGWNRDERLLGRVGFLSTRSSC